MMKYILSLAVLLRSFYLFPQNVEVSYNIDNSTIELHHQNLGNYPVQIINPFQHNNIKTFTLDITKDKEHYKILASKISYNNDEKFITIAPNETLVLKTDLYKFLKSIKKDTLAFSSNKSTFKSYQKDLNNKELNNVIDLLENKQYDKFSLSYNLIYRTQPNQILKKWYNLEGDI